MKQVVLFVVLSFLVLLLKLQPLALPGWSNYIQIAGVGNEADGAGAALVNLDGNPRPELILMAYDAPSNDNSFRYKVGWNVNANGSASSWSNYIQVPGLGWKGQGAGIAFCNLDSNARPEMVLMAYDNPSGNKSFRYKVGWNVGTNGKTSSWSNYIQVTGVGWEGQGAGVAFCNFDGNARPEMVLMAYDNPSGNNGFRYRVGWNVGTNGKAAIWGNYVKVDGVGWEGQGADILINDLDDNGSLDMILMAYDNPAVPIHSDTVLGPI